MNKTLKNESFNNLLGNLFELSDEELLNVVGGDPSAGHGYQSGTGCQGISSTISSGGTPVFCGGF